MTKYVVSRFNQNYDWLSEYTDDYVMYDRSEIPAPNSIPVPNIGSDLYDKFTFIIDNYDNLPDVAIYTKCNLFKYISREEFDKVKDNTNYTPLCSQEHKTYLPICWYENGLYAETNDFWYLGSHPPKNKESFKSLKELLKMDNRYYNLFAPGSGYILTRQDIQRHSKSFYEKLRSYLDWSIYPGECQILERSLHYLWGTDIIKE